MEPIKALSLGERASLVRDAFREAMGMEDCCSYVTEVYEDYAIVCEEYGEYYRAGYSMNGSEVMPEPRMNWTRVEMEWGDSSTPAEPIDEAVMSVSLKSAYGSTVKALGGGKVGGHLVLFSKSGELDLYGEYFDDQTDFDLSDTTKSSIYYQHGKDKKLKTKKLGSGSLGKDDVGVWIEGQLDLRDEYERAVYRLVEAGKMGWSSGTAPHLVEYEDTEQGKRIKRWPLGLDATITPTPADPRQIVTLKAYLREQAPEVTEPEAQPEPVETGVEAVTVTTGTTAPIEITIKQEDKKPMAEETKAAPDVGARVDGLESAMKKMSDNMSQILGILEKLPKGEGNVYTNVGGAQDPEVKSLGDFCLAVKRGDVTRIRKVYKAQSADEYDRGIKALSEDQGATGGYMVPPDFSSELVAAQNMVSPILNMVRTFPVSSPAGEWPVLDIYRTVTAGSGNTAMAGGLISSIIAEAGTFTDRNVYFKLINWRVSKIGDILNVSSEMAEDAPAMDMLLRQVMTTALASKKEYSILRGNGVGEPIGIINAPALISYNPATSNVFAYADSVGMIARLKMLGGDPSRVAFLHHISVLPDVASFQTGSAGTSLVQSISGTDPSQLALWTKRLIQSEHLPQADNDNSVILADLGAYGLWQRGAISIAFSTDYAFNTDQVTWRFKERYDGRPLAVSTVTLADPQGSYTQSAFVGLLATHS